ncbi:MAG TPA: hypothetical protein VJU77_03090 [Chthoniobacterales bacterium]|nr:hypothetical protein [Chthoniobacterales bacterium]
MFRKILSRGTLLLLLFLGNQAGKSASPSGPGAPEVFNPGPDAIAGNMEDLASFGIDGTQQGLAIGITTCNAGDTFVNFFPMPNPNHPAVAQNLYRMSGNSDRFEQIGQSWVKHTFGAKQAYACFECMPGGDLHHLGVGCSDTYLAFQSSEQSDLGSRAWINPFTGAFTSTANDHTGHNHTATSHMILTESNDLNTALNPGATYYAELLYVTSDEYAWCQAHPGECNMSNNASYRQYNVTGTSSFTFSPAAATVRMSPAISAWTGATVIPIEPAPGVDGRAFLAYKVSGPVGGVYHYEYAIYNQNLDRGISYFRVPLGGCGNLVDNIGFHAPLNHPGFPNDGTGGAGFSNTPWLAAQTIADVVFSTESFAQNPNANAIRWGTLYNFRFDSGWPPIPKDATVGFFKTADQITVSVLGPNTCNAPTPSRTPTPSPTPTPTPSPLPTATPCPNASITNSENFDQVIHPALPADWVATNTQGPAPVWVTSNSGVPTPPSDSFPNAAFVDDPSVVSDKSLQSRTIHFFGNPGTAQLTFRHNFDFEPGHDGGVLEVMTETGAFEDIIAAGGSFVTGGYNSRIFSASNPLDGRQAWSGGSGGFITTKINLAYFGQVVLRWRMGSDAGVAGVGWRVDSISITECPKPTPSPAPTPTPTPGTTSQAVNLSSRLRVLTGDNVGIGGFIVTGAVPKHVLLRGIGPSLAAFGVANPLANPTLDLRDSSGVRILANNDWRDTQEADILATGLQPTNNLEAAIVEALAPGSYTVILRGMGMTSGVGLVEIYDLDQGVDAKLANLSTRAFVDTGDNLVIAGFILGNNGGSDRVVVRGIGPSLGAFGVPNPLANPKLELRDGNGALLRANNDWQDDPAQAAELVNAGLAPTNNLESGIAATLAPGLYTALLSGVNNGTGIGLVEIYDRGAP